MKGILKIKRIAEKLFYTTFLVFIGATSFSQDSGLGSWNILNVKYKLNEKWSVFGEAQIRSLKFYDHFHYHEYKAGVTFKALKNLSLTIGAGDYDTYKEGGNFLTPKNNDEFRLWPQISFTQTVGQVSLEHRYRAEFRFTTNGFKNRYRYRFGATYPFGSVAKGFKRYQVHASNEIFFTDREPYFERNRAIVSVGYKITKETTFQLGYLHQFDYKINDETGRDFLQMGVYFDLAKKITESIKL